jgi:uncharacterized damage-inducible protein DinB
LQPPPFPAGPFQPPLDIDQRICEQMIAEVEAAPKLLRDCVAKLTAAELDTKYKNWTIRQIVHHLADSHVNSYVRFKWALTEETPTIKPYEEGKWAELADSRTGDIGPALALVEGLHQRWVQLLRSMTMEQFSRAFFHPETGQTVSLVSALCYYVWHAKHHTGQIQWLQNEKGLAKAGR